VLPASVVDVHAVAPSIFTSNTNWVLQHTRLHTGNWLRATLSGN
jgi:hypothetical protein